MIAAAEYDLDDGVRVADIAVPGHGWIMGEALSSTILINRQLLPHAGGPAG